MTPSIDEARSLVFTLNPGCTPAHAPHLRSELRGLLGGVPASVRVASRHVELAAMAPREALEEAARRLLADPIDPSEPPVDDKLEAYLWLLERERFWEAHEILEPLWASGRDLRVQALILAAAALARAQEGSLRGAERNISVLEGIGAPSVDTVCLRKETLKAALALEPSAANCLEPWWRSSNDR